MRRLSLPRPGERLVRRGRSLVASALALSLTGCFIFGVRDNYATKRTDCAETGEFVPDFYLTKHTTSIPLFPFHIELDRPPHDLVMLTFDQTFHESHEGF